jgi:hypothetical protein
MRVEVTSFTEMLKSSQQYLNSAQFFVSPAWATFEGCIVFKLPQSSLTVEMHQKQMDDDAILLGANSQHDDSTSYAQLRCQHNLVILCVTTPIRYSSQLLSLLCCKETSLDDTA